MTDGPKHGTRQPQDPALILAQGFMTPGKGLASDSPSIIWESTVPQNSGVAAAPSCNHSVARMHVRGRRCCAWDTTLSTWPLISEVNRGVFFPALPFSTATQPPKGTHFNLMRETWTATPIQISSFAKCSLNIVQVLPISPRHLATRQVHSLHTHTHTLR